MQRQIRGGRVVQRDVTADEQLVGAEVEVFDEVQADLVVEAGEEMLARLWIADFVDGVAVGERALGEARREAEPLAQGDFPEDVRGRPAVRERVVENKSDQTCRSDIPGTVRWFPCRFRSLSSMPAVVPTCSLRKTANTRGQSAFLPRSLRTADWRVEKGDNPSR